MKKALLVTFICIMTAAGAAFGQRQKLSFNDNNGTANAGTYGPNDIFSVDVFMKFSGFHALGLSYWLEVQNGLAPKISITNVTYFTFLDPNQTVPNPAFFNTTVGAHAGYRTETRDLGATPVDISMPIPPGTYMVSTIQFTLNGAAPGTYLLKSTTLSPHGSEVNDTNFVSHFFPASTYRITIAGADRMTMAVVPEPTTFTLLWLAATGCGLAAYRRRSCPRSK